MHASNKNAVVRSRSTARCVVVFALLLLPSLFVTFVVVGNRVRTRNLGAINVVGSSADAAVAGAAGRADVKGEATAGRGTFYGMAPERRNQLAFEESMRLARQNNLDEARRDNEILARAGRVGGEDENTSPGRRRQGDGAETPPMQRLLRDMKSEHDAFLATERELVVALSGGENETPPSSSPRQQGRHNAPRDARLLLVATDLYRVIDAYFDCALGFDELRPFRCAGFDWPSQTLPEEKQQQESRGEDESSSDNHRDGQSRNTRRESREGLLMTLVDGLTTLILTDSAVARLLPLADDVAPVDAHVIMSVLRSRFAGRDAIHVRVNAHVPTADRRHIDDLVRAGLSNTTAAAIVTVLRELERRMFVFGTRYLSVFELNIRLVGGLVGAHDLLARAAELSSTSAGDDDGGAVAFTTTAASLLNLAVRVGNGLLPAFRDPARPFRVSRQFGFPRPFVRASDGTSINPRRPQHLVLSEVGTLDIEFAALSRRSGCRVFGAVAEAAALAIRDAPVSRGVVESWVDWMRRARSERGGVRRGAASAAVTAAPLDGEAHQDIGLRYSQFHLESIINNSSAGSASVTSPPGGRVEWTGDLVTLGALSDSYYEYRVKALIFADAAAAASATLSRFVVGDAGVRAGTCQHEAEADDMLRRLRDARGGGDASATPASDAATLLDVIRQFMIECEDDDDDDDDGNASFSGRIGRCLALEVQRTSRRRRMSHLACFAGGMFALASRRSASSNATVGRRGGSGSGSGGAAANGAAGSASMMMMRVARGLAMTCADMSRVTVEGVAGEEYAASFAPAADAAASSSSSSSAALGAAAEDGTADLRGQTRRRRLRAMTLRLRQHANPAQRVNQQHVLRPEALESLYYTAIVEDAAGRGGGAAFAAAFAAAARSEAWRVYIGMRRRCRAPRSGGFSGLKEVHAAVAPPAGRLIPTPHATGRNVSSDAEQPPLHFNDVFDDVMPSFAVAETFKYSLALLADCSLRQSRGSRGGSGGTNGSSSGRRGRGGHHAQFAALFLEVACEAPLGREWVYNTEAHPIRLG